MKRELNIFLQSLCKSIFIRPNADSLIHVSGIDPLGRHGLGYSYYLNDNYRKSQEVYSFIRGEICKDLSYTEIETFCEGFERQFLPILLRGRFISWQDSISFYNKINEDDLCYLKDSFIIYSRNFIIDKKYHFPLKRFKGHHFSGSNFSIGPLDSLDERGRYGCALKIPYLKDISLWVTVSARSSERAFEKFEAISGALALAVRDQDRYTFVSVNPIGGHLQCDGSYHSFPLRTVPSVMEEFLFTKDGFVWLSDLDRLLSAKKGASKHLQALRFFSFAWFARDQERYALHCMCLDALVPNKLKSMKGKCEWIKTAGSSPPDLYAIEILMKKIRSSLLHGDHASLPACPDYPTFVASYNLEPLIALDYMVADILKTTVFRGVLVPREDLLLQEESYRRSLQNLYGEHLDEMLNRPSVIKQLLKGLPSTWEQAEQPSWWARFLRR